MVKYWTWQAQSSRYFLNAFYFLVSGDQTACTEDFNVVESLAFAWDGEIQVAPRELLGEHNNLALVH
jgi:hypothetical protein